MSYKKIFIFLIIYTITSVNLIEAQESSKSIDNFNRDLKSTPIYSSNRTSNISSQLENTNKVFSPNGSNRVSSEAGTTVADFEVSLSGGASYNIPFATPPGIKDINPNIGLNFNSQAKNGLAGWGWNISGLSTITRVASTLFHDGEIDKVDFDNKDRFSLDGQRLILSSGAYGVDNSEYQTEKYSNIKIKAYGVSPYGSNYGPSTFKVFYPDGSIAWYGQQSESRGKLEWALWKKEDPQGNYIEYRYNKASELLSIDKILFGSRTGTNPPIVIQFVYKNRKRPELAYVEGIMFKRTNILDRVEIYGNGQVYRKYVLTHDETFEGYERVISVQEFNAGSVGLTPISFTYDDSNDMSPDTVSGSIFPGYNYQTDAIVTGEFNGDGRLDFIKYNKNQKYEIYLYDNLYDISNNTIGQHYTVPVFDELLSTNVLNNDGNLLSQQGITFVKESVNNNDLGTISFNIYHQGATSLHYQYSKSWTLAPTSLWEQSCDYSYYKNIPREYVTGDFNGDGISDVLAVGKRYYTKYCDEYDCGTGTCCSCNTYFTDNKRVDFIDLDKNNTTNFVNNAGFMSIAVEDNHRLIAADFNGDGKTDLFHFKEGEVYIYELDNNNQLSLIHSDNDGNIKLNRPILLGDYNGDGKTDFITPTTNNSYNWKFFLSKGNSVNKYIKQLNFNFSESQYGVYYPFGPNQNYLANAEVRFSSMDVNGDGKTDIVRHAISVSLSGNQSEDIVRIQVNKFDENDTTPSFEEVQVHHNTNSDITSFGIPIQLNLNENNKYEYAYLSSNYIIAHKFKSNFVKNVTLKQINNNGLSHQINYFPLTTNDISGLGIYTGNSDEIYPYININVAPSLQLVEEVKEIGGGHIRTQKYRYSGAVTHAKGIGFLGFKQIKKSNWYGDNVSELWNITDYNPQKRGAVIQNWVSEVPATQPYSFINKNTYTYQTTLTSNNIFINVPTQVISEDNLTSITKTKFFSSYDNFNNPLVVSTTYPGGSEVINFQYYNNQSATSEHYAIGRLTKKATLNTLGSETFSTEEKYVYNLNLLSEIHKKGNGTPWIYEYHSHDDFGNVTKKEISAPDLANRTETFEYDISGRFLTKSISIEGLETINTYDQATGNLLSTTDPYEKTSYFQYDDWQRLTAEINYLENTTRIFYENSSNFGSGGLLKTIDVENGQDIKEYYNAFGWIVRSSKLSLNNKWVNKDFDYDVVGRKIRVSENYFDSDSASQWNKFSFDNYGRQIAQQLYTGKILNMTYNGLSATIDDGVKTVTKTKDAVGNVVTLQDPGGTVHYYYFANNVMKLAKYESHVVTTDIDGWGRKIGLNDPSAGEYSYKYNELGEILLEITPNGSTEYLYDDFGKLKEKIITGNYTNIKSTYTYDLGSKLLSNITSNDLYYQKNYTYEYYYDNYYRTKKVKETTDNARFSKEYTYNTNGRIESENYSSQSLTSGVTNTVKVKNIYDSAGILMEIIDESTTEVLWRVNSRNARDQDLSISLGNEIVKTRTYDNYGFLTEIYDFKPQFSGPGGPPESPIIAMHTVYDFDPIRGTLNKRQNHAFADWIEVFSYDSLDRLTEIEGPAVESKSYDPFGRISNNSTVGSYVYNSTTYQLDKISLNSQGDLHYQQHNSQLIKYNAFKKPVSIHENLKGRVDFRYGPMMNRTYAYYGGEDENVNSRIYHKYYSSIIPVEIIENQANASTKIITYIGGDAYSAPIAYIKQQGDSAIIDEFHFIHRDYLGSILAISDSSHNISEERQFGAWGSSDQFSSLNGDYSFSHNSLIGRGFTGHEHFFEVGLLHMNGRMYDAKLGRFLSPDNYIQDMYNTQSFNRFGYTWNNPLSFNDPSGEFFVPLIIGAFIGVAVNGIVNTINGQGFFEGAIQSAIIGGVSGVFAFGVGEAVQSLIGTMKVAVQMTAHGHFAGTLSSYSGGEYLSGFLSGSLGSIMAHGAGKYFAGKDNVSKFNKFLGTTIVGGASGGAGRVVSGGKFWDGVRNGLISSTLNHSFHSGVLGKKVAIALMTGKMRHLFGPDAISISGNITSEFIIGVKVEKGYIVMLRGEGAWFDGVAAVVGLPTLSAEISVTELYYSGSLESMTVNTFTGAYYEADVGFDVGVSVGVLASYSPIPNTNEFILGFGVNVGVGVSPVYGIDANIQFGTLGTDGAFKNKN